MYHMILSIQTLSHWSRLLQMIILLHGDNSHSYEQTATFDLYFNKGNCRLKAFINDCLITSHISRLVFVSK